MNEPIYLNEEHRQFRDNLRRFIDQEIVPRAAPWVWPSTAPAARLWATCAPPQSMPRSIWREMSGSKRAA